MIPGMGADERLFGPQKAYGLEFEVPKLPIPDPEEQLADYALRVRDELNLTGPCVVGGVSFGGMLACELACVSKARCVLLVASCKSQAPIPRYYRFAELFSRVVPDFLIRRRCIAGVRMLSWLESLDEEQSRLIGEMSKTIPITYLRRAGRMVLNWTKPTPIPCPVYHIHGAKDRIIPIHGPAPDEIVPDGGHLINLTHADLVNQFLKRHLEKTTPKSPKQIHSFDRENIIGKIP